MRRLILWRSLLFCLAVALPAHAQWFGAAGPAADPSRRDLPPPFATNQFEVEVPFAVTPGTDPAAMPAAIRVFVSWDFGRNWHKYTDVSPDVGKFRFRAKKDAEFWFVTQVVDAQGNVPREPPRRPQLRLIVDTQKPRLEGAAVLNPAGQVEFTFSVVDSNLQRDSLKVEYQLAGGGEAPWEPVAIPPEQQTTTREGMAGKTVFLPLGGSRAVNVRAEVRDAAGNVAYFAQQISLSRDFPPQRAAPLPSPLALDAGARRWPSDNRTPYEPGGPAPRVEPENLTRQEEGTVQREPEVVDNPHVRRDRLTAGPKRAVPANEPARSEARGVSQGALPPPIAADTGWPPPSSSGPSSAGLPIPRLTSPRGAAPQPPAEELLPPPRGMSSLAPQADLAGDDIAPLLGSDISPLPAEAAPEAADTGAAPGNRAEADGATPQAVTGQAIPAGTTPRLTNSRRFSLDYDVESVGPEGIAEVELWGTSDGGRTWLKWGNDPDRTSPMDVEVSSEATYGFRVVVVGKNGLEGNKPAAGDDADIWVTIDATPPDARLTAAAYGSGAAAGKLDIRWDAADAHLGQRPVTLLYGDRPDGKFTVIAAGLENTGQYLWKFDPRSPRKIYLRLEVRDDAGNIAADQLSDPINVEGLIPKGRIRSLTPAPEPIGGAGNGPPPPLWR